jgi:hypothetical protein
MFKLLIERPHVMILDIATARKITDQPIFRPSAEENVKVETRLIKFLEIVGGGVISVEREASTMIPGLLASQRNMYNRLHEEEKR